MYGVEVTTPVAVYQQTPTTAFFVYTLPQLITFAVVATTSRMLCWQQFQIYAYTIGQNVVWSENNRRGVLEIFETSGSKQDLITSWY